MKGSRVPLEVDPNDTIKTVRRKIRDCMGLADDSYCLFGNGKELIDEYTLSFYRIKQNSIVYLWQKMHGGCFLPNTFVLLADHTQQRISSINPGDQVLAFTNSGEIVCTTVKQVFIRQVDSYADLTLGEENTSLKVTLDHLCYAGNGEFKVLEQLLSENRLFVYSSDPENKLKSTKINHSRIITAPGTQVYNLHTDYPNTFFANGVAVHNMSGESLGMRFVDVSHEKGLKCVQWSQDAPQWRQAFPGICLEGKCPSSSCPAFNQSVIINIGLRRFNVLTETDKNTSKCPKCSEYVEPISCAFNRCRWRCSGIKIPAPGSPPVEMNGEWQHAENAYYYFDEQVSGQVQWRELILEAVSDRTSRLPNPVQSDRNGCCIL